MTTTTTTTYPPLDGSTYAVRLIFSAPSLAENLEGKSYYRLVATVQANMNMPAEIFLHQRKTRSDATVPYIDEFVAVCGPIDLNGVTTTPDNFGMLRKREVDMLLPTIAYYKQVKDMLIQRVQGLCDALTALDTLEIESVYVADSPATSTTTTTAAP